MKSQRNWSSFPSFLASSIEDLGRDKVERDESFWVLFWEFFLGEWQNDLKLTLRLHIITPLITEKTPHLNRSFYEVRILKIRFQRSGKWLRITRIISFLFWKFGLRQWTSWIAPVVRQLFPSCSSNARRVVTPKFWLPHADLETCLPRFGPFSRTLWGS